MAVTGKRVRGGAQSTQLSELLGALAPIEVNKEKLPAKLEEIGLETQLLTLADLSLERETEVLRELLAAAKGH